MNLVSVTRLRIRSWRYLPGFFYFTLLSFWQARRAKGNLGTSIRRDAKRVFWTLTVWRDERAMREFRNNGTHRRVMPKLLEWCDEATYAHWHQEGTALPDISTAYQQIVQDGIVSKVKHPSPDHATLHFPPPWGYQPTRG